MPLSRRRFIQSMSLSVLPLLKPRISFSATLSPNSTPGDVLVCVFQRGGVDGLNMIVPHADDDYHLLRQNLAIPRPGEGEGSAIDLDGFFGLHPSMSALKSIYDAGDLAAIHATGSPHETHSHFDAMDFMERAFLEKGGIFTGWLGRHLASLMNASSAPFRAVGMGNATPTSLRGEGAVVPVAISSIEEFDIITNPGEEAAIKDTLGELYDGTSFVDTQAQQTLAATALLNEQEPSQYEPENGAEYPTDEFGQLMLQVGQLIKTEELGVEAICVDIGGWDTHNQQAGILSGLLTSLSDTLAAFYTDMGTRMDCITLITQSEFGRRAFDNASLGTDHGHGNCMLAMGGGVNGGQVFADWPGLGNGQLYGPGDLDVTTDWRTVLGELVSKRLGNNNLEGVFPEYTMSPNFLGVFQSV